MKHLDKIEYLSKEETENIIDTAKSFKAGRYANYPTRHAALMFFENSTRTRFSFECAIKRLGAKSYVFDTAKSSILKGEELFDTINNMAAIGIDTFIIRTREENLIGELKEKTFYRPVHFINAGEGKSSHPTQALLDYYTIIENLGSVKNKKIVIAGDIKHSRVARSNIALLKREGANIVCCAPKYFQEEIDGVYFEENLNNALLGADIVMCLRIQTERLEGEISKEDYIKNYRISKENLPENALLMHPGPVNRDVEITSDIIDSPQGQTILKQAENGVYIRMAVLDKIFKEGRI